MNAYLLGLLIFVSTGVGGLAISELVGLTGGRLGRRCIEFAAKRLPAEVREDRLEEWRAEWAHFRKEGGPITALAYAALCPIAAIRLKRARTVAKPESDKTALKLPVEAFTFIDPAEGIPRTLTIDPTLSPEQVEQALAAHIHLYPKARLDSRYWIR